MNHLPFCNTLSLCLRAPLEIRNRVHVPNRKALNGPQNVQSGCIGQGRGRGCSVVHRLAEAFQYRKAYVSNMAVIREASHAGSWYSSNSSVLRRQLSEWLDAARAEVGEGSNGGYVPDLRAIIAPHAGYSYSGPTAAFAYAAIDPTKFQRVIILGPSHHVYMDHCSVTAAHWLETPLGDLEVDHDFVDELKSTGMFGSMESSVDTAEHSIELHLPYVAHVFSEHLDRVKVATVLVGSLSEQADRRYGELLSKYLADPANLFIVSSDFCHWGRRFRFTYYDQTQGEIYRSIEHLDRMGIEIVERRDPQEFVKYLRKYSNTICGRHPITVFLFALQACSKKSYKTNAECVRYAQSSRCLSSSDSSVSYVSIHITKNS